MQTLCLEFQFPTLEKRAVSKLIKPPKKPRTSSTSDLVRAASSSSWEGCRSSVVVIVFWHLFGMTDWLAEWLVVYLVSTGPLRVSEASGNKMIVCQAAHPQETSSRDKEESWEIIKQVSPLITWVTICVRVWYFACSHGPTFLLLPPNLSPNTHARAYLCIGTQCWPLPYLARGI